MAKASHRFSALIASAALLFAVSSAAEEQLDIFQAIKHALAQNKSLAVARLSLDSGRLRVTEAEADFNINFVPDLSSSRTSDQTSIRYGVSGSTRLEWGTKINLGVGGVNVRDGGDSETRGSLRFELQQPIFRNFGRSVARDPVHQAESNYRGVRRKYELQKADLVLHVVRVYENILRLRRQAESDRESAKRNDALYRVTRAKEGAGKTTRVDTLRVELLRGQALARLETGQEHLASTQREFAELLGFPLEKTFELAPAPALDLRVTKLDEAVQIALTRRLDYAQVIEDYEDAARGAIIAGRRLAPDLRVTVSYDDDPTTTTAFGSVPTGSPLWFVGISSSTDFNLARERIALDQAKVTETAAAQSIDLVRRTITRQVQQQLEIYRKARAELDIAESNLAVAARRAKLATTLFELGRGDNFSVTDAEVALLQAESHLYSARADASISVYQLAHALGEIVETPDDLKPLPETGSR